MRDLLLTFESKVINLLGLLNELLCDQYLRK